MKKCKRCGGCCCDVQPMSPEEIERIKEYLAKRPYLIRPPRDKTKCMFLRQGLLRKYCAIYKVRPDVCRVYSCQVPVEEVQKEWDENYDCKMLMSMYDEIVSSK